MDVTIRTKLDDFKSPVTRSPETEPKVTVICNPKTETKVAVELLLSVVWTSQSTPAERIFAYFARLSPCAKTQCDAYKLFCGTNSHNQCCNCWGFFTRSGVFLFHLGFWGFC